MADEDFGPRSAADVNMAPGQVQGNARKRRAKELAGFLQRRGISAANMQTMHPALLEHHWRAAGLKQAPSEETMRELAKHMRPGAR